MAKQKSFTVVVLVAVFVFGGVLAAAVWWGKFQAVAATPTPTHEIAEIAAEHGSPEYATSKSALHHDHNEPSAYSEPIDEEPILFAKAVPLKMPLDEIRARLDQLGADSRGAERVQMEAALGFALLLDPQPDLRAAGKAFITALNYTPTPDARVPMARDFGVALLDRRGEAEVLEVTESGRFIGARLTPARLQIEAIRGIAYDELGLSIRAQDIFRDAFEAILDTTLNEYPDGRDVARTLALRLARKYRDAGDASAEDAVSKRLRAWLGEEALALR